MTKHVITLNVHTSEEEAAAEAVRQFLDALPGATATRSYTGWDLDSSGLPVTVHHTTVNVHAEEPAAVA